MIDNGAIQYLHIAEKIAAKYPAFFQEEGDLIQRREHPRPGFGKEHRQVKEGEKKPRIDRTGVESEFLDL